MEQQLIKLGNDNISNAGINNDKSIVLGIDIGGTLIGMHLKKVAVPVKLENRKIGEANVLAARVRPKFIGGQRAIYDEHLM